MKEPVNLYTIGYEPYMDDCERFAQVLKDNGVKRVFDVRSNPTSKNREYHWIRLGDFLFEYHDIGYHVVGEALGGKVKDESQYVQRGRKRILDPKKREEKYRYMAGIMRVVAATMCETAALMCYEGNPRDCHRGYTLSESIETHFGKGHKAIPTVIILHIMPDGSLRDHDADIGRRETNPF